MFRGEMRTEGRYGVFGMRIRHLQAAYEQD
jgi:hypothetical protein